MLLKLSSLLPLKVGLHKATQNNRHRQGRSTGKRKYTRKHRHFAERNEEHELLRRMLKGNEEKKTNNQ